MRNTFNFLLALLNFTDSCFLLGMILEVLRNNFRLETNFHRMIHPYFLYPLNSIALTFSIFMTISIAFERYDAMHNIAQHNQVSNYTLVHYRLWSFKTRDTKLERFFHTNQHTQRKLLNFENCGVIGRCQKLGFILVIKLFKN